MSNLCKNKINITGEAEQIKAILVKLGEIPVNTKAIVFETLLGSDMRMGGVESNLRRFGTKMDVSPDNCNIQFSDNQIIMSPKTEGTPPFEFCKTLAKDYEVNVELYFHNKDDKFCGMGKFNTLGDTVEEFDENL